MISILSFICINACVNAAAVRELLPTKYLNETMEPLTTDKALALWEKIYDMNYEDGNFFLDLFKFHLNEDEIRALLRPNSAFWKLIQDLINDTAIPYKRINIRAPFKQAIIIKEVWLEYYQSVGTCKPKDGEKMVDEWFNDQRVKKDCKRFWIKAIPKAEYGEHKGGPSHCPVCKDIMSRAGGMPVTPLSPLALSDTYERRNESHDSGQAE